MPVPDSPLGIQRPKVDTAALERNYDFTYTENPFGFQVIRASDQVVLFDTRHLPLVFEDQYLEISTSISENANIYGFGETPLTHFKRQKGVRRLALRGFLNDLVTDNAHAEYNNSFRT